MNISLLLIGVFIEELLYRYILLDELLIRFKNKLIAILISASIFAISHLINISSVDSIIPTLIQVGYSFILGLILGLIYYLTKNFLYIYLFHLSFNFFNSILISYFFTIEINGYYCLINIIVGLITLIYSYLLYYKNKDVSKVI